MNVPNALTILRIILGFAVPVMMVYGDFNLRVWVAIIFFFAALTDWFDGWYARRYNLVTKLGKILDPIADKVIVLGSFLCLSSLTELNMFSYWWVLPIIFRELVITIYRMIFLLRKRPAIIAASWSGKAKTMMQFFTLPVIYFLFMFKTYSNYHISEYFYWWMYLMLAGSLILTLQSGIRFFVKNWKLVKEVST